MDKKKIKISVGIIGILVVLLIIFAVYDNICEFGGCDNFKSKGSNYCEDHKCIADGCTAKKSPGSNYCYYHVEENAKKYEEEDRLELSDSQIEEIKRAIKEYTDNLMEKQDNILAVNLLGDVPSSAYKTGITFNCNVVRTDSDTNLATIYIVMNSDGSFKVQSLMYDNQ